MQDVLGMSEPGSLHGLGRASRGTLPLKHSHSSFLGSHISRAVLRQGQSPGFSFQPHIPPWCQVTMEGASACCQLWQSCFVMSYCRMFLELDSNLLLPHFPAALKAPWDSVAPAWAQLRGWRQNKPRLRIIPHPVPRVQGLGRPLILLD